MGHVGFSKPRAGAAQKTCSHDCAHKVLVNVAQTGIISVETKLPSNQPVGKAGGGDIFRINDYCWKTQITADGATQADDV